MQNDVAEDKECKKCGSVNFVMVQYDGMHPDHYDGVSEIACEKCGARFGRWSGKELAEGETERPGGRAKK